MPLKFTRSYWKQRVPAEQLDKVRAKATELDPTGGILDEDADCVRVIGTQEQINDIERAAGIGDQDYWNNSPKPPGGSVLEFKKPEKPAAEAN